MSNDKYQMKNIKYCHPLAASTQERKKGGGESKFRKHSAVGATLLTPAQQNKHHISHFKYHTKHFAHQFVKYQISKYILPPCKLQVVTAQQTNIENHISNIIQNILQINL